MMSQFFLNTYDRFANTNGIQIVEMKAGYARCEMTVESRHLNGADVCQGGALFTLADLCMAAVVNGVNSPEDEALGVGLSVTTDITYHHPGLPGIMLIAEASYLERGRKPRLHVDIRDAEGMLIAEVEGMFVRTTKLPK
ncbi:MAG: PaaI family thioesterase [Paludibacteraceae bacterium]|nr:PaaI family thioesterase [Paludibacteraceae bacterium]